MPISPMPKSTFWLSLIVLVVNLICFNSTVFDIACRGIAYSKIVTLDMNILAIGLVIFSTMKIEHLYNMDKIYSENRTEVGRLQTIIRSQSEIISSERELKLDKVLDKEPIRPIEVDVAAPNKMEVKNVTQFLQVEKEGE